MNQRRKITWISVFGLFILLSLIMLTAYKRGQTAQKSIEKAKVVKYQQSAFQTYYLQYLSFLNLDYLSFVNFIKSQNKRVHLIYVFGLDCNQCLVQIDRVIEMKMFYEPLGIGVQIVASDPPEKSRELIEKIKEFSLKQKPFLIQPINNDTGNFIKYFRTQKDPKNPVFWVLNKNGKLIDSWFGPNSIDQIDSRFRKYF